MNILLIHQYYLGKNEGGGSRFNEMCKYWAEDGFDVTVVAGTVHYATGTKDKKYKGKWNVREQDEKVKIIRCFVLSSYNKSFLGRLFAYVSFFLSSLWAGLFYTGEIDTIVATSPPLTVGLTAILLSFFKKTPFIFEVRDLWPDSAIQSGVLKNKLLIKLSYWLENISYRKAKKIVVLTPAFKEYLLKRGIAEEKIAFIPNAADLDLFEPGNKNNWVRKKYNLGKKFVVLYTGAHGKANALSQLIEAANLLREYKDIVFMLVGDGMEKNKLKKLTDNLGLNNVIFVDTQPKDRMTDFINASDVCTAVLKKLDVFKTVYPNKIFDYMACGKPIIIGIDGAARKLIEDANCGVFAEPENAEKIKDRVLFFYSNRNLCKMYGSRGRKFVEAQMNRKIMAERYEELLKDVSERNI